MRTTAFLKRVSSDELALQWWVTRRDCSGAPSSTFTIVDHVRLQVYRHIARPQAWTAYASGLVGDVVLVAKELEEAQQEALGLLADVRAQQE